MKKISCIIIDDEKNSAKMLQSLLAHFCPHVEVLALIHKPADAVEWLTNHDDPQVVFLDIEMPGMNGFQLLDAIPRITSNVIFTTAYEQFAIRAFKTKAISYLLKPIDGIDLQAAVEKAVQQIGTNVSARIVRIEAALHELVGEVLQELGIAGRVACADVVDGVDDPSTEEVAPVSIDDAASKVRILFRRQPLSQLLTTS